MKHHLRLLLAIGVSAMSIGAAAAVHDWTATRVGSFDADYLYIADINDAGQVALWSQWGGSRVPFANAFLYTPGSSGGLVNLGSLGGQRTSAAALNASGQVVGASATRPQTDIAPPPGEPYVYRDGRMQGLGLPGWGARDINGRGQILAVHDISGAVIDPGGSATVLSVTGGSVSPYGINNRGQVFGNWARPTDPRAHSGFLYDNGRMIDLGTLGGNSSAAAMNGSGQIVGEAEAADGRPRPFLYGDGRMTEIGATNYGGAVDINDRGQVLGWHQPAEFSSRRDAFIYGDGEMHEVGGLDDFTRPEHLNELGQVVGFSGDHRAFFYSDDDGRTTDLTRWLMDSFDDVAAVEHLPLGLNDLGQIAIGATMTNGRQTLFVLTPIPEPSTYALMLAGIGTLAWIARRQRGRPFGNRADQTHPARPAV